jgi:FkbM family methyltransferase
MNGKSAEANGLSPLWFYKAMYGLRPAYCGMALKRIFGVRRRVISFVRGEFFIDPCSHFGLTLLQERTYEEELVQTLEGALHEGGVFVDVGANEGYFSIVASKMVGPSGKVIAVEPQSRLQPVLERNVALNGAANVQIRRVAVSDHDGSVQIYLAPDTISGATSLTKTRNYPVPRESVCTMTLAQLLSHDAVEQVDLMKMDIEGFEYEAILGAKELFRAHRVRKLALELHTSILRKRGLNPQDIVSFLREAGYSISSFDKFVICSAQPGEGGQAPQPPKDRQHKPVALVANVLD